MIKYGGWIGLSTKRIINRVHEDTSIWKLIKKRRNLTVYHILSHEGILVTIIERTTEGKIVKHRPGVNLWKR